jgi:predicted RNA methylase
VRVVRAITIAVTIRNATAKWKKEIIGRKEEKEQTHTLSFVLLLSYTHTHSVPRAAGMRLRDLEALLQSVPAFESPKAKLEQYPTGAHLASRMLFTMHSTYDDLQDALVADLGVGCGVLSIGCVAMGAGACVGFDIDQDALQAAQRNAAEFELDPSLELVQCNVAAADNDGDDERGEGEDEDEAQRCVFPWRGAVDTVVMNPPFGTKNNAGIDMAFLRRAVLVRCKKGGEGCALAQLLRSQGVRPQGNERGGVVCALASFVTWLLLRSRLCALTMFVTWMLLRSQGVRP